MAPWSAALDMMYASDLATDATYTPSGGTGRGVRVIADFAQRTLDATGELVVERRAVRVRRSEVADPGTGDTFTIAGTAYRVQGDPLLDETAGEWTIEVVPA